MGSPQVDPLGYGQRRDTLHGKILRLAAGPTDPYSVPADNPFYGTAEVLSEIWAYGLRNPWRCSCDRATGDFYMGDVGQSRYEEVNFRPAGELGGENYGWNIGAGDPPSQQSRRARDRSPRATIAWKGSNPVSCIASATAAAVARFRVPAAALMVVLVFATALPAAAQEAADVPPLPAVGLVQVVDGLELPLHVTHAGDDTGRLFVVEQTGKIRIVENGALLDTPFLDLGDRIIYDADTCGECGLLGLAFPPDFEESGYFVVGYTTAEDVADPPEGEPESGNDTVIARFKVSMGSPNVANPASEERLLRINQPYSNHNNGMLLFGPDGKLYAGLGDGGSGGDPLGNGQRRDTLLGKILRLDVGPSGPYTIPPDNPFVGEAGVRAEIWAYGVRNPWRFSFDRNTGDFWMGDVGQQRVEEVNFRPAAEVGGENYGWDTLEGTACYPAGPCDTAGLEPPVYEYGRDAGDRTVTGGYAYRGPGSQLFQGAYIYGDFNSGRLWVLQADGAEWVNRELLDTSYAVSAFGEDEAGALYLLDYGGGRLLRVDLSDTVVLDRAVYLPYVDGLDD